MVLKSFIKMLGILIAASFAKKSASLYDFLFELSLDYHLFLRFLFNI